MCAGRTDLDGVLVADKQAGYTSHDVVELARRRLRIKKVGHLGALDPIATGCLPLCVGRATRLAAWLRMGVKVYKGVMKLGLSTDTYDITGKLDHPATQPDVPRSKLIEVARDMTGELDQIPPIYSAKKIKGVPLYKLARQGRPLKPEPVRVKVERFDILDVTDQEVSFEVACGPGTYVRSLVHDLGSTLGCGAVLVNLRRIRSGAFSEDQAVRLQTEHRDALERAILPLSDLLPGMRAFGVTEKQVWFVQNGQSLSLSPGFTAQEGEEVRLVSDLGDLLGIGLIRGESGESCLRVYPKVVLKCREK
ncbi:tRNA pseudouridine(55) synthase TruB [Acidobacteriota bacterium]